MKFLPQEVNNLVREHRLKVWLLFGLIGVTAVLEAMALVSLLFLGHRILGQELPELFAGTWIGQILDGFSDRVALVVLGIAFLSFNMFRFSTLLAYQYIGLRWSIRVVSILSKKIMARVTSADLRLFSESQPGEIIHAMLIGPVGAVLAVDAIVNGLSAFFLILMIGITLSLMSPLLFGISAVMALIFFGSIVHPTRRRVRRYQQDRFARQSAAADKASNIINGIREIRAAGTENTWIGAYAADVEGSEGARMRVNFLTWLPGAALQTALQIGFAIAVVSVALIRSGEGISAEVAIFGVFAYALFRISPLFNQMSRSWIHLAEALPNLQNAEKWIGSPQDALSSGTLNASHLRKGIRFDQVSFSYDSDGHALKDACFLIEAGKTTAIVGPSGSGKSTLIDLILKFRSPDTGTIWLDDQNLKDVERRSWLDRVGLVDQEVFLFAGTIKENLLAWKPDSSEDEILAACYQASILDYIESLDDGLNSPIGDRGVTLSGGQRQRLAIARALLRTPEVLILDESTSDLDSEVESRLLEALFNGFVDRTTILISHRLSTVRHADRVVMIDRGAVVGQGTHEELLATNKGYQALFAVVDLPTSAAQHQSL